MAQNLNFKEIHLFYLCGKIPEFHLISSGHFLEVFRVNRTKLCRICAFPKKFSTKEIRLNFDILSSASLGQVINSYW